MNQDLDQELVDELLQLGQQNRYAEYLERLNAALASVETNESGEQLLPLKQHLDPRIQYDLVDLKTVASEEARLQLRKGVIERLNQAQKNLPKGCYLVIRDAFRSEAIVWSLYHRYIEEVKKREPELSDKDANLKIRNILAMPDDPVPPGHMTGGAIDVILADKTGERLPLTVDEDVLPRAKQMITFYPDLPDEIKENRQILYDAMIGAGFHNYFREFWHYSYGDAYWAVRRKQKVAIYGIPSSIPIKE